MLFDNINDLATCLNKYTGGKPTYNPGKPTKPNNMPCYNALKTTDNYEVVRCMKDFNNIYKTLKYGKLNFAETKMTNSGNIKSIYRNYYRSWKLDIVKSTSDIFKGINLTVCIDDTIYKCSFGQKGTAFSKMNGFEAYREFKKACKLKNIDLSKYEVDQEKRQEIKESIPRPRIDRFLECKLGMYHHVYHLDIHSAYPAGVINTYPEFRPVFDDLYKINKIVGPLALGYMQSKKSGYKYINFPYLGVSWCRNTIDDLCVKLAMDGFVPLVTNTDGIWYVDADGQNRQYHDENEGTEIGQWKTDHKDCDFQARSSSYYYYKENGEEHVVARGKYAYEYIKPRDLWNHRDYILAIQTSMEVRWDEQEGLYTTGWSVEWSDETHKFERLYPQSLINY